MLTHSVWPTGKSKLSFYLQRREDPPLFKGTKTAQNKTINLVLATTKTHVTFITLSIQGNKKVTILFDCIHLLTGQAGK